MATDLKISVRAVREARLAGGEGSAPERAQAYGGVGPKQRDGSTATG